MNFSHYTDSAVALAADLANLAGAEGAPELQRPERLATFLEERGITREGRVTAADVEAVRALCERLRAVFDASDEQEMAERLNAMIAEAGVCPDLTDHDGTWHLHYAPLGARLAQRVAATTVMALAMLVAEFGGARMKACDSDACDGVFVDLSRNQSRRYCCDRCANRENVAAYRARQRKDRRVALKGSLRPSVRSGRAGPRPRG